MKNRRELFFALILMVGVLALWGCPKKADVSAIPEEQSANVQEEQKAAPQPEKETAKERAAAKAEGLETIYFDFDRAFIRDDARSVMKANAEWLKANPKVQIKIEGNCDERGTIEYNQALGQRRAASAKKYLTDLGISAKRISLISYGKEKPICSQGNEDCWQKNRRDDFVAE